MNRTVPPGDRAFGVTLFQGRPEFLRGPRVVHTHTTDSP